MQSVSHIINNSSNNNNNKKNNTKNKKNKSKNNNNENNDNNKNKTWWRTRIITIKITRTKTITRARTTTYTTSTNISNQQQTIQQHHRNTLCVHKCSSFAMPACLLGGHAASEESCRGQVTAMARISCAHHVLCVEHPHCKDIKEISNRTHWTDS